MIIYLILFGVLLFGTIYEQVGTSNENKKRIFIFLIIVLGITLSTRGLVGYDWYSYKRNFDTLPKIYELITHKEFLFKYEIGFQLYTSLIKTIFNNYYFYNFVNTALDFILIYAIFKRDTNYPIFSLFLFYSIFGLPLEVDIIRNMKGILLFLISVEDIQNRKFSRFLFLNIVGILFHYSAIIYIPLYFILNRKWNKNILILIFVLGNIYYLLDSRFLIEFLHNSSQLIPKMGNGKLEGYLAFIPLDFPLGVTLYYIERIVLFLLIFCSYDRLTEYKYGKIMINSFCIGLFIFLFFAEFSIVALRLQLLFVYSYWFIIPILFQVNRKIILFILIVLICYFRLNNQLEFPSSKELYRYNNFVVDKIDESKMRSSVEKNSIYKKEAHGREISVLF